MSRTHVTARGVRIPIGAVLAAIEHGYQNAHELAADDHDEASPGGARLTPGEVVEELGAFFATLAVEAIPAVLRANGIAGIE